MRVFRSSVFVLLFLALFTGCSVAPPEDRATFLPAGPDIIVGLEEDEARYKHMLNASYEPDYDQANDA